MDQNRRKFQFFITIVTILVLLGGLAGSQPAAANWAGPSQAVIVQAADAEMAAALVKRLGGEVTSRLEIINGVGALVPEGAMAVLRSADGVRVSQNAGTQLTGHEFDSVVKGKKKTPASDYPNVTGADLAWEAGVTGQGVTVAVLDTGIANHPSLKKGLDGKKSKIIGWVDFVEGKKKPTDPNGHGTHIAGIIGNAALGPDGEWNGMAPGVNLVGVRVLDETGAGDYEKVIQGIQWVIQNKAQYNIQVLNVSLYALVQSPYWADPLNQAVMRAWAEGITVIVAAGNGGPNPMTITVPGNNPYAITVGSFTDAYTPQNWGDDYLTEFSAAGPTLDGFVKPDVLAPGAHMVSTMMPGSFIARNHEANWVDGQYFSMAGTSQAAAVVSGTVALTLSNNANLSPDQVKYRMIYTALPWINAEQTDVLYSVWQQGAGRLNAYDMVMTTDLEGYANQGMDIVADLNGAQHYEGYSYFDETTGTFRLHGFEDMTSGFGSWAGGYGTWSGGFGSWASGFGSWASGFGSWAGGFGSWASGFGSWASGFGSWASGFGSWASGFGSWAGGFGSWAGGFGSWAGGFGSWAGGFGSWAGGFGVWAGQYYEAPFYDNFTNGVGPDIKTKTESLHWIEEPEE